MKDLKVGRARKSRSYIAPSYKPYARFIMNLLGGPYLRFGEKLTSVSLINPEPFCRALKDQEERKYRLIILFRHADKADAPALMHSVNKLAAREGRKLGISYDRRPHTLFLYGKDVPNWAGPAAAWLFPRLGNIPVINRGLCRESVDDIRRALKDSPFPLALAPEGQVTYHARRCFSLEAGVVHMAEWARESGNVRLLPVAISYDYGNKKREILKDAYARWTRETGIQLNEPLPPDEPYAALLEMCGRTLDLLAKQFLPDLEPAGNGAEELDRKIAALNDAVLKEGERIARIRKSGTVLDRIFKLRYKGVAARFPEDRDPALDSPWQAGAADYETLKAAAYIRCSQITDVLEYVHCSYISPGPADNRHCEFALNLLDLINRFKGGDIGSRYVPGTRMAYLATGDTLDPASYDEGGSKRDRSARLLKDLKDALQSLSETPSEKHLTDS